MAHSPASIRRLPVRLCLLQATVIAIVAATTGASAQLLPAETSTLVEGTSTPVPPSSGGGEFGGKALRLGREGERVAKSVDG